MHETETLAWRIFHETFYVMTTPAYLHMVVSEIKEDNETDFWNEPEEMLPCGNRIGYVVTGGVSPDYLKAWAAPVYVDDSNPKHLKEYQLSIAVIAEILWRDGPIEVKGDTSRRMLELFRQYTGQLKLQRIVSMVRILLLKTYQFFKVRSFFRRILASIGVTSTYTNLPSSISFRTKLNSMMGMPERKRTVVKKRVVSILIRSLHYIAT